MYKREVFVKGKKYSYYYHNIRVNRRIKNICLGSDLKEAKKQLEKLGEQKRIKFFKSFNSSKPLNKNFTFVLIILLVAGSCIFYFDDKPITGLAVIQDYTISFSEQNLTLGTNYTFEVDSTTTNKRISVSTFNETTFVIAYQNTTDLGYGNAVIGEISGENDTVITFGPTIQFSSEYIIDQIGQAISVATLNSTTYVIAYVHTDPLLNDDGQAIIGEVRANQIVNGSEYTFDPGVDSVSGVSVASLNETSFVIAYRGYDNTDFVGTAIVGIVSGDAISFPSGNATFHTGDTLYISVAALNATKFVIAYDDDESAGFPGKAIIGDVDGTTITYGSTYVFNSDAPAYISAAALDESKFVIAYQKGTTKEGRAIIGDVDGTTITYGSEYVFNKTKGVEDVAVAALNATKFIIAYDDYLRLLSGHLVVGEVDGNVLTFGSEYTYVSGPLVSNSISAFNSSKFVVAYQKNADPYHGDAIIGDLFKEAVNNEPTNPSVVLNFTEDNINYTNATMWCEIGVSDPDAGDTLSIDVILANNTADSDYVQQWRLDNAFTGLSSGDKIQLEIHPDNYTVGDYVICEAVVNDGTADGPYTNSSSLLVLNSPPWWNETSNTTYLYNEDFGTYYTIWNEDGLNNTFQDTDEEDNHLPYNCTVSVNDTGIISNIRYNGSVIADSISNAFGIFILTVNCSDSGWLSELTSFEVTIVDVAEPSPPSGGGGGKKAPSPAPAPAPQPTPEPVTPRPAAPEALQLEDLVKEAVSELADFLGINIGDIVSPEKATYELTSVERQEFGNGAKISIRGEKEGAMEDVTVYAVSLDNKPWFAINFDKECNYDCPHCYNRVQDGDEEGIDCGGSCTINCQGSKQLPKTAAKCGDKICDAGEECSCVEDCGRLGCVKLTLDLEWAFGRLLLILLIIAACVIMVSTKKELKRYFKRSLKKQAKKR